MKKFIFVFIVLIFSSLAICGDLLPTKQETEIVEKEVVKVEKPKYVRGIHISAWAAGSKKFRDRYDKILKDTEINTIVIAVKEANGDVYINGIKEAKAIGAYRNAMPYIKEYIDRLHKMGIFVIARQVLFKDPILANAKPKLAVHDINGNVWKDYKGLSWVSPYNKDVWEYNFKIVDKCIELGFDEIQFDYIRFPSDGNIRNCRYSVKHSSTSAVNILAEFLKEAKARYTDKIDISVDVFGLTTSSPDDLGIGQIVEKMEPYVDAIYPMVYPSHYKKGTYGILNPNKSPYDTVYNAMYYGKKKLGNKSYKYRAYLQDFSMGYKYGAKEIRDQIQALYDNDIGEWVLWDSKAKYTLEALLPKSETNIYKKQEKKKEELDVEENIKVEDVASNAVK
jgi:hypothetical protein